MAKGKKDKLPVPAVRAPRDQGSLRADVPAPLSKTSLPKGGPVRAEASPDPRPNKVQRWRKANVELAKVQSREAMRRHRAKKGEG
jgi:hypothetical protein